MATIKSVIVTILVGAVLATILFYTASSDIDRRNSNPSVTIKQD